MMEKLIASEINHLKLDVVWIILSTCDLAYTDGVEAEGPSGLVNADFLGKFSTPYEESTWRNGVADFGK